MTAGYIERLRREGIYHRLQSVEAHLGPIFWVPSTDIELYYICRDHYFQCQYFFRGGNCGTEVFFSPAEVAVRWNCSAKTVTRYCQAKVIRYMKLGKLYRIALEDLEEFERSNTIELFSISEIHAPTQRRFHRSYSHNDP